jgi:hypothetical protein
MQYSQQADIHDLGEIRTRNASNRQDSEPRLRQRGHRDLHEAVYTGSYFDARQEKENEDKNTV